MPGTASARHFFWLPNRTPRHLQSHPDRREIRIDLIVADEVLVELKSVERLLGVHQAQLLTYLKLTGKRVGLLINFNVELLKQGVTRLVNGL